LTGNEDFENPVLVQICILLLVTQDL